MLCNRKNTEPCKCIKYTTISSKRTNQCLYIHRIAVTIRNKMYYILYIDHTQNGTQYIQYTWNINM